MGVVIQVERLNFVKSWSQRGHIYFDVIAEKIIVYEKILFCCFYYSLAGEINFAFSKLGTSEASYPL